jgi:hypothetical protein
MIRSFKYILYTQFLLLASIGCNNTQPIEKPIQADDYYEKCRKLVLSENKIGQEYFFKITKKEVDEFTLTYLGNIKTAKGDTIKFLNAVNYFGQYEDSKRANGAVLLYNKQDDFLGMYQVGSLYSLPNGIEKDKLVFNYKEGDCNQTTAISFLDSIPKQIFINCTKDGGDLYSFTKE